MRLTEPLAGIELGKFPINLSVGEPRHSIPEFVEALTRLAARAG